MRSYKIGWAPNPFGLVSSTESVKTGIKGVASTDQKIREREVEPSGFYIIIVELFDL